MTITATATQLTLTNETLVKSINVEGTLYAFADYDGTLESIGAGLSTSGVNDLDNIFPLGYNWRVISGSAFLSSTTASEPAITATVPSVVNIGVVINDGYTSEPEVTDTIDFSNLNEIDWFRMRYLNPIIIKGSNNQAIVKIEFEGEFSTDALNNFSRVDISVGGESYSTQTGEVAIESATELSLSIGTVTQLSEGYYDLTIIGFSTTYPNGYVLNSECIRKLTPVFICE